MATAVNSLSTWLDRHPAGEAVLLALVPAVVYTAAEVWLSGAELVSAAGLGVIFGVTFAVVLLALRRVVGE